MTTDTKTDELALLREAAEALQEHERRRLALKASDDVLRALCRRICRFGRPNGSLASHAHSIPAGE